MEENKPIELRSEKVRNIIGRMPPVLVRYGTAMIVAALLVLTGIAAVVPYRPTISIEIAAAQDEEGGVHYTARIPQEAMAEREHFISITGSPPVEGAMPVRYAFQDVPDTLYVSPAGGWYEVPVYPLDTPDRTIKIPESFSFPAKIELGYSSLLKWVAQKVGKKGETTPSG